MKTALTQAIEQVGTLEISNDHLAKVRALLTELLEIEREQICKAHTEGMILIVELADRALPVKLDKTNEQIALTRAGELDETSINYYTTTFKNKGV